MRLIPARLWGLTSPIRSPSDTSVSHRRPPPPLWRTTFCWIALLPLFAALVSNNKTGNPLLPFVREPCWATPAASSGIWETATGSYPTMYLYGGLPKPIAVGILFLLFVSISVFTTHSSRSSRSLVGVSRIGKQGVLLLALHSSGSQWNSPEPESLAFPLGPAPGSPRSITGSSPRLAPIWRGSLWPLFCHRLNHCQSASPFGWIVYSCPRAPPHPHPTYSCRSSHRNSLSGRASPPRNIFVQQSHNRHSHAWYRRTSKSARPTPPVHRRLPSNFSIPFSSLSLHPGSGSSAAVSRYCPQRHASSSSPSRGHEPGWTPPSGEVRISSSGPNLPRRSRKVIRNSAMSVSSLVQTAKAPLIVGNIGI